MFVLRVLSFVAAWTDSVEARNAEATYMYNINEHAGSVEVPIRSVVWSLQPVS